METMHKVRARIMQVLGIFIICLFMLMTVIGTYQIVTRYFFNKPSTCLLYTSGRSMRCPVPGPGQP